MDKAQRVFLAEVAAVGSMTIAPNSPKLMLAGALMELGYLQKKGEDQSSGPTFMPTKSGYNAVR